jgi:hypothetical protein
MEIKCPEYASWDGSKRCGEPAEVTDLGDGLSTGGSVMFIETECSAGHNLRFPAETLVELSFSDVQPGS